MRPHAAERSGAPGRSRARALVMLLLAPVVLAGLVGCSPEDGDHWADQLPETVTVATGGTTGIYHAYGTALAAELEQRYGVQAEVLSTGGSVENLHLLADGSVQIAFSAADAAGDAVAGTGEFGSPVPVRSLARVYDDFAHLVVPATSGIRTLDDLRGLTVSVGAPRSGTSLIAHRVLEAAEVDVDDLQVARLGITESIEALEADRIDAFFWSGGLRTPGVEDISERMGLRLVPMRGVVDELREEFGHGYRHGVVPDGMYGLTTDVETLAVPNVLLVGADMPDDVARGLAELLFATRNEISGTVGAAALLDRTRAIYTSPIELHPGALRYYRQTKL